jgi:RNA polymerase primary sigma factor
MAASRTLSPRRRSTPSVRRVSSRVRRRIERLLQTEICFVHNAELERLTLEEAVGPPSGADLYRPHEACQVADRGAGRRPLLPDNPLLSPAGERHLFRKLNFLRFRANRLRSGLNPDNPDLPRLRSAESALAESLAVRNRIAECNLRLVVALARRFARNPNELEDLIAEGNIILLKAADKFDYALNYRFSTYATFAIQRHLGRWCRRQQRLRELDRAASEARTRSLSTSPDEGSAFDPRLAQSIIGRLDAVLDERERHIIRQRYGLNPRGVVRTLRELADDLKISKERVRQIQHVALEKLHQLVPADERAGA